MSYKEINLQNYSAKEIKTEIMFEVVSERVSGTELLKINIRKADDERTYLRAVATVHRMLKQMKQRGAIQFFATPKSFSENSTEAKYLLNKYPEMLSNPQDESEAETFVYVRI